MTVVSNSTQLKNRILWYDGDSTVSESTLNTLISNGTSSTQLFVDSISNDILQYNRFVSKGEQVNIKQSLSELSMKWIMPDQYTKLDMNQYVISKFEQHIDSFNLSDIEIEVRARRIARELTMFTHHKMFDVLRVLIFVINKLTDNNIVWGTGRGSSVASYVLYLIGVHDVDSVLYELDINEFLR